MHIMGLLGMDFDDVVVVVVEVKIYVVWNKHISLEGLWVIDFLERPPWQMSRPKARKPCPE